MASRTPLPFFIKKLTVMGMMGHTQGVSKAAKPPKRPMKKIHHRAAALLFSCDEETDSSESAFNSSMTGTQSSCELTEDTEEMAPS